MEKTSKKPSLDDVKISIKKLMSLNEIFLDSVKYNKCECYDKYSYVSFEMGKYIWILIDYFDIEL